MGLNIVTITRKKERKNVSLVHPHLEYADQIWDPYTAKDCELLESVQRFAGRVCLISWDLDILKYWAP